MGKSARKAGANTAGNTSQMRGAPGRDIPDYLATHKLPTHKTNGQQANK